MHQLESNILQNRLELRSHFRTLRSQLSKDFLDRVSSLLTKSVINLKEFKNAKHVMLYYPIENEINLLGLLECSDKIFYFPKCSGNKLLVCPDEHNFSINKYGIKEPNSKALDDLSILDLIITPALCIDKQLHRLGYGKGYYDRFFKNELKAKKIVVTSEKFLVEKLPIISTDVPVDIAVLENCVIQLD